jgi:hypothetical protein
VLLQSRQSHLLHELSDLAVSSGNRITAIGDEGILLEGRLVLDGAGRLAGVTDASLSRLVGEDGKPLTDPWADAEGLAVLSNGDRLVSFETRPRIWLYPKGGGRPGNRHRG